MPGSRLRPSEALSLGALVTAALFFSVLLYQRATGLNGPSYWRWPWLPQEDLDLGVLAELYLPPIACFGAAQWLATPRLGSRHRRALSLALLMACAALLMHAAQEVVSPDVSALERAGQIIQSLGAHSYYTEAQGLVDQPGWLSRFPEVMAGMRCHAANKPPAFLLAYSTLFRLAPPSPQLAQRVALGVGLVASCVVPAIYALARTLGQHRRVAFAAASLFALVPALGAFWPSFDAAYPLMTALLVITWHRALGTGQLRWAAAYGLSLALAIFVAYNFLILGVFLVLIALLASATRRDVAVNHFAIALVRPGRQALVAIGSLVLAYLLLHAATGFGPIVTFEAALAIQDHLAEGLNRPWDRTVIYDLTDYALGMAWLPVIPALAAVFSTTGATRALTCACLAQPLTVSLLGIMPTETARTWIMLMPFVLLPAAIELGQWRAWSRQLVYVLTLALSIGVTRSMLFVAP